jgi:hypothetical protein
LPNNIIAQILDFFQEPVLATSLIHREKEDYHVVLLSSHNYLEQHDEQIPWLATSALNTKKTLSQKVNEQV